MGSIAQRRLLIIITAMGVALALVAAGLFWLSRSAPAWWHDAGRLGDDARERSVSLERGAATALHERREGDEVWGVLLRDADANAWLAHRLGAWLANRGVAPVSFEPRVRFGAGVVWLGIGMEPRRVMWMRFDAGFELIGDQPALRLTLAGTGVGRIPVPGVFVRRVAQPALAGAFGRWLSFDDHARMTLRLPAVQLGDGRRVVVRGVEFDAGVLVFRCQTLR